MELVNRYVTEVGKHLPRKNRTDIQGEIRSTLQDMLEDRSQETGHPVDDAMTVEVLKAYGSPEAVAATYLPERYLIGPRLYPFFMLVIRIVFTVISVLAVIGLGFALSQAEGGLAAMVEILGKQALQYVQGLMMALGNIVFVFFILERFLPDSQIKALRDEKEPWDPASLMKEPDPDTVKIWEPVLAIVFLSAMIALVNFFPQLIGILFVPGSEVTFLPILSQAFFRYVPWLNVVWGLEIILNLGVLRQGRWTRALRWISIVISALGVAIAVRMLTGPSLVALTASSLTALSIEPEAAGALVTLVNLAVRLGLAFAIIGGAWDIIKLVYRMVVRPAPARYA